MDATLMPEHIVKVGISLFGGPGRDRTDDLFHAISLNAVYARDWEEHSAMLRGSVHAGLAVIHCLLPMPTRHHATGSRLDRDGSVMTQTTTRVLERSQRPTLGLVLALIDTQWR
jgi:hypothetical protein